MLSRRRFLRDAALGGAIVAADLGCRRRGNEIVLGAVLGMSGANASLGQETKEGMGIALEEIEAAGGVLGRKVKVLYEDTMLDPSLANEKMHKLVDREQVLAVIGDASSGATLGARRYAEQAKVPLVSGSATNVEVTKHARYVFRVCFTDDVQGKAAAKFARDVLEVDAAAILYVTGNKYSEGLQSIFESEFTARGGRIVAKETYQDGETNILTFIQKIKDANPQLIFAPVYPNDLTKIGPTKLQLGLDAPLLGTDGWDGPATRSPGVIESLQGCYFTDLFAADGPVGSKEFVETYLARYQRPASSLAAGGYDALKLVCDAITRAKSLTSEALRDALEQTKGFKGVTGTIDIDAGHNAQKPVPILKIVGTEFKFAQQISV